MWLQRRSCFDARQVDSISPAAAFGLLPGTGGFCWDCGTVPCLSVCYLHRAEAPCARCSQTSDNLLGAGIAAILLASLPCQLEGTAISGVENDKSIDPPPQLPSLGQEEEARDFCKVTFRAFQLSLPALPTRRPLLVLSSCCPCPCRC